ncbi:MAG: hypothetical protein PHU14_16480 [Methylovulum sp.]|nr:hypothetical protein [Methylovulum sp.]
MKRRYGVFILANLLSVAHADRNINGVYTLPPNKAYIEPCQREALLIHPGIVEQQRILHKHGFRVRYQIVSKDGSESIVLCDLANGKSSASNY